MSRSTVVDIRDVERSVRLEPSDLVHRWLDGAIGGRGRRTSVLLFLGIAAGFVACFALRHAHGGEAISTAWYILMILAGAAWFGYPGAVLSALVATALAGPAGSLADEGASQGLVLWAGRGVMYLVVGVLTAALIDRVIADRRRELELVERERDLAIRKAAVLATVSHEFRTPLTIIVGVARTLEAQGMVSDDGRPLLSGLSNATRRLTDLVNTIGAVLDAESNTFVRQEPVILREVLQHVILSLGVRDPGGRLSLSVDPSADVFVSDRELLDQLLRHIVENAVRFSPEDQLVDVAVTRNGQRLTVVVSDRGMGIEDDLVRRADPFRQGDPSMTRTRQGLGLGLFAASRIAAVMGGSIRFEARKGGGTVARIEVDAPDASTWAPTVQQRGAFVT